MVQSASAIRPGDRPGDKAFLAKDSNGVAVLCLFDDGGQVCAVFQATDWIERVVDQVGRGKTGKLGQAMWIRTLDRAHCSHVLFAPMSLEGDAKAIDQSRSGEGLGQETNRPFL